MGSPVTTDTQRETGRRTELSGECGASVPVCLLHKEYLQFRHGDDERQGDLDVGVVGVVQGH